MGGEEMKLDFYKQSATPYRVDKSGYLTSMGSISNVVLKENTNLMSPTFILKTQALVYNSNYLYCDFMGRWYYIDSIEGMTGGRIAIHCKIDVLFTYKDEIKASSGWVVRSETTTDVDEYDMLHNNFTFQSDYIIEGHDLTGGSGWESPFDPSSTVGVKSIYMALK